MAEIVLGIGTAHSPLLTFEAETWLERAEDDRRNAALNLSNGEFVSYQDLVAARGEPYTAESELSYLEQQSRQAQMALDHLSDALSSADPDLVIVIGDDHEELYTAGNMPSFAIYYGEDIVMRDLDSGDANMPHWLKSSLAQYAMDGKSGLFKGDSAFGLELIERLLEKQVDVGVASSVDDETRCGMGHAFGFIAQRLFRDKRYPILPILLNTYYPPNVIRPSRCYDIGRLLREAIEEMPGNQRVAIVASGGLSHFVTDERLDREVLAAIESKDATYLRSIPMGALNSGSSEILCWVMAAGALEELPMNWSSYIPVYRSSAGTGIGLGFITWAR